MSEADDLIRLTRLVRGSYVVGPGPRFPPMGIAGPALPIWQDVLSTYADLIFAPDGSIADEWVRAIGIFEQACHGRGVRPWAS